MKAMTVLADKTLSWANVPDPVIDDDEVLIEVTAAGVNRADLLQREGNYPPPPGSPDWLGLEASGVICDMGSKVKQAGNWRTGDPVCALMGGGAYAEYAAVPQGMIMPIPSGVSLVEAAAIPEAFGASYMFLFEEAGLKAGDTLLITAGASGLASVTIPMAKAFGARVLTTVRTDEFAALIRHLWADRVIVTEKESVVNALKQERDNRRGVDIVIDCLGGQDVGDCLPFLNHGGRWIIIAALASDTAAINLKALYMRGARLIGTTLRGKTSDDKARMLADMVRLVWPKVESGRIRPSIYKVLPIQQAEEAHAVIASGSHVGKIVLTVR